MGPAFESGFVRSRPGVPAYTFQSFRLTISNGILVIPVIDEGLRLLRQLDDIAANVSDLDVVIADGGSRDGSTAPEVLLDHGVTTLLTLRSPGRLSSQLRMAFDFALRRSASWVVTMDGNGKDDAVGISGIVSALEAGAGFVQGSRFIRGGVSENTPRSRLFAIRLVHAPVTSLAARRHFTDTTNGFRGHSAALLRDPRIALFREVFDSYELLAYLPIAAARSGHVTREVPVARRYPSHGSVPTKIRGIRGNWELTTTLLSAALGAFSPSEAELARAEEMSWPGFDPQD